MQLTQKQLAEQMSTTQQTIARWETGKTPLNAAQIKQLCGLLKCTAQDLLGWEVEDEEEAFDASLLLEQGPVFGTLKVRFPFGVCAYPIGMVARASIVDYMDRHDVLNGKRHNGEMLVVATLTKRLLLINAAAVHAISLVSDDYGAMPSDDGEPLDDELMVTFFDGSKASYLMNEYVASEVFSLLIGHEPMAGCFMMVEDEGAGEQSTYVDLGKVAMLDLSAELFESLTSDDGEGIAANA
jgi:DNA-binding Xre family transcriptional regulator